MNCTYCLNTIVLVMGANPLMRSERNHDRDCIYVSDGDFLEQKRRDAEAAGDGFPRARKAS